MKKMKESCLALLVVGVLATALPASAHHGTGVSYDASHPITMKGVVTEFHYANPHPQLYFDVTDDKGNVVHWGGEFYPNPSQLIQGGWGKRRTEAARTKVALDEPSDDKHQRDRFEHATRRLSVVFV